MPTNDEDPFDMEALHRARAVLDGDDDQTRAATKARPAPLYQPISWAIYVRSDGLAPFLAPLSALSLRVRIP